jgi:hypothetical protein
MATSTIKRSEGEVNFIVCGCCSGPCHGEDEGGQKASPRTMTILFGTHNSQYVHYIFFTHMKFILLFGGNLCVGEQLHAHFGEGMTHPVDTLERNL